ncbi:hypothetical protein D3C72_711590 [compost metagenome]
MILDEECIPASSLKSFLPAAKCLLQGLNIQPPGHTLVPQGQMFKLEDHIELALLFTHPHICLLGRYPTGLSNSHDVVLVECLLLQLQQEVVNAFPVHMTFEGRYIFQAFRIWHVRESG